MEWKLKDLTVDGKGSYGIGAPAVPYQEDKLTYLRITDINDDGSLNFSDLKSVDTEDAEKYILKENDIVFARTGNSTGRSYFYEKQHGTFVYAGFLIKFSLDPNKVNPRIMKYYTHSKPYFDWVNSFDTGATRGNINAKTYGDMEIELPSRKVQNKIVSILSSLDRKIELNNKINADLEEMAQAIFKNWFVDFEPFKDDKFVDSELGMIPEGWKVGRLTDVIKLMPGGTPKTSEPLYWDNGTIPFFSPKDVNGVYCFATEKHITEAGLNKCSSNLYPKDTIFITCRGTVGKVCLVACDMAMNQSNYAIKAIDGYSQYYVFFLVKSVVERLIKKSNGAVFSAITSKDFDEEILIPSQNAVEDFTNVIDGFFRRIFTIGTENYRLSLLRDTLLPRLMSGELEVPE